MIIYIASLIEKFACVKMTSRKRKVLSIEDKLIICELVKKGTPYGEICDKYGIGKSTISDIKKKETEMRAYVSQKTQLGMAKCVKDAKTMHQGYNEELDQALYIWFKQCREKNIPVTGPLLMEKASYFYNVLYPNAAKPFSASTGFQWRFCNRFGIRGLAISGEKLSADYPAAEETVAEFPSLIEGYALDQIFNCDETGLYYRLLPKNTLASTLEKRADGMKKAKDRITVNACSNVTGTIKLPLLFIGKAKNPRCFKGINTANLPVVYRSQKNAWVDTKLFTEWFHDCFVPYVTRCLIEMGLEPRAKLFLDNCSAHPEVADLTTDDGKMTAHYFRANITSLLQPMDQGVLESMKRIYRKNLLRDLIAKENHEMIPFLKAINMLHVIDRIAIAWDQIKPCTIRKSWQKLIPLSKPIVADETMPINDLVSMLSEINISVTEPEVIEWLENDGPGYEHLSDQNIVEHVTNQDNPTDDISDEEGEISMPVVNQKCPVSHKNAMDAFDTCLTWLRFQEESSSVNTATLISLRELAAEKRESGRKQSTIHSFFK